ncbi:hypothetical protein [Algoriphagus sp. PAP.12]|uniref:hypothetical protein n=1 Tax=Algoriphagus sp. PAP.12 TaxID=2996678 RepID=UPI00227C9BF8|nr:hypothetical protein [Algoriphagus sp. PAP.12]
MSTISQQNPPHSFHIPVMGLGYTVDSPIKVAHLGISSVISIMDDQLLEMMRKIYSEKYQLEFHPIHENEEDSRAKRITAFLDLTHDLVFRQLEHVKAFENLDSSLLQKYIQLLPLNHPLNKIIKSLKGKEITKEDREAVQNMIKPGKIDINIMTKVDKINYDKNGNPLSREYSDALSALRGYANSKLESSVIFSAGMNPALFAYAENFEDFFPDDSGFIKKKICLKVSDYRSALIQGKFLAKKGLWVSEFRIESGLNCGGHAFATDGFLIGPILEEFKSNRAELKSSILEICNKTLHEKGKTLFQNPQELKITYQGGIGTAQEDSFLRSHYELDGTGWGSPFLLVPEATSVDQDTMDRLLKAKQSDYFLSAASPLGVPFNNLRNSSGEDQRKARIEKNRPGSPCYKKFLSFSTEFTEKPICTASRQYQNLKAKLFQKGETSSESYKDTLEKDCLCEGLSAPAILANGGTPKRNLNAVTICPGPNLAYFKGTFSLQEMVDHIYGKISLNLDANRPHVFIKELQLYITYLKNELEKVGPEINARKQSYFEKFKSNLLNGMDYYKNLIQDYTPDTDEILDKMKSQMNQIWQELDELLPKQTVNA